MKKYFIIFKLAAQDLFQYKLDFFLNTLKYSFMVLMMSIVWLNVEKEGQVGLFNSQQTVSYFLISAMLYSLSNFHPWYVEDDIRLGYLSKYLVKPISPMMYYFSFELARVVIETVLKITIFISILFFMKLLPNLSFIQIIVFFLYCPFVFIFSFQWLTLISTLAFWITEAYAVRWAVTIFTRLLSGILVPIVYFPDAMQQTMFYLPFEHLAFTPIEFMLGRMSVVLLAKSFGVLMFWIFVLSFFRQWIWRMGTHNYEGTGI